MNTCPHCGICSISRWRRLLQIASQKQFRCPTCGTWLAYRSETASPPWYEKYLQGLHGLLVAPAILAFILVAAIGAVMALVYRLDDGIALALLILVLLVCVALDSRRILLRAKSAQLVISEQQVGIPALLRQAWGQPDFRWGLVRLFAFFVQLFIYVWLIGKLLPLVSG
jgi:hypothetical protein